MTRAAERAWLAVSVLFTTALVWHHMTLRGDAFWSLAGGDWVLSHGAIPDRDPFAFTSIDAPFLLPMPAFQVLAAWIVAHAGLRALMLACALPIAGAASLLWLSSARSFAARVVSFPLVLLYVEVDAEDISARGQAFGDLAFAALVLVLFRLRSGRRVPWWCPVLLTGCWASFHPSFTLAIALPLGFAVVELLEPPGDRPPLAPFFAASLLATAGSFLTPQPLLLFLDSVKLPFASTTLHIDLFTSPDFRRALWVLAPGSAIALAALRAARGAARGRAADAALLLLFVAATCTARRYGTLLVAIEIAIAGPLLDLELPRLASGWRVPLAAVAAAFITGTAFFARETKDPLALVPAGAVAAVDRIGAPDRIVDPFYWGGYLEWVWKGRRKVFIDGRVQLFVNGTFDDAHSLDLAAGWSDVLDTYEARTVLWLRHSPLDDALAKDPRWAIAYSDAMAVVYVRR